jgi:pimeloyl-ACP methyl ester carboxylesterase
MISRRLFAQGVAGVMAAGTLAACSSEKAAAPAATTTTSPSRTKFAALKQIKAGPLNIGYAEDGPADGPAVFLLHGWPYSIYSYVDVAPVLAAAGYRVIVPYLRGYGTTTVLSADSVRNGQQAATATDLIALMDALHIDKAVLGGYDWGSRTAGCVAAVWPERVKAAALVSGYLVTNLKAQQQPLSPVAERGWWYQYYFSTERGVQGYTQNRHDFNKLIWQTASPSWKFSDATYDQSAAAFDNPDHVAIVIHNYRWRLGLAQGEPQYDAADHGADDHHRQRLRRRRHRRQGLPVEVHRQVRPPHPQGHRPQRAAGGPAELRQGRDGRRQALSRLGFRALGSHSNTVCP